jgi:NAD(P)H-hydrate repair Nnr-like enzyme with NAD(P)H-hydrate dehydratase domain
VIATPGQLPRINVTGNASLATAGTGDVLAGWTAGLWSQASHSNAANAGDVAGNTAAAAAGQHGQAADKWLAAGHRGPLRAAELIEASMGRASA